MLMLISVQRQWETETETETERGTYSSMVVHLPCRGSLSGVVVREGSVQGLMKVKMGMGMGMKSVRGRGQQHDGGV